jgi:hypothetical protein
MRTYPHFNTVVTPEFYDKESKQFDLAQLERDRKICELRYTCEVVFSRGIATKKGKMLILRLINDI